MERCSIVTEKVRGTIRFIHVGIAENYKQSLVQIQILDQSTVRAASFHKLLKVHTPITIGVNFSEDVLQICEFDLSESKFEKITKLLDCYFSRMIDVVQIEEIFWSLLFRTTGCYW